MVKAVETKCECSVPFTHPVDGDVECRCTTKVNDGGRLCWLCKLGGHTSPKFYTRLKKLPQFGGKSTD